MAGGRAGIGQPFKMENDVRVLIFWVIGAALQNPTKCSICDHFQRQIL